MYRGGAALRLWGESVCHGRWGNLYCLHAKFRTMCGKRTCSRDFSVACSDNTALHQQIRLLYSVIVGCYETLIPWARSCSGQFSGSGSLQAKPTYDQSVWPRAAALWSRSVSVSHVSHFCSICCICYVLEIGAWIFFRPQVFARCSSHHVVVDTLQCALQLANNFDLW